MPTNGMNSGPRFPIYIPSKGRAEYCITMRALDEMGVPYSVVVEPQEFAAYKSADIKGRILELDMSYKGRYELCDRHGLSRSTGSGPARNFIWDYAAAEGAPWHWIMDDNIKRFYRFNRNLKVPAASPSIWRAMEDFTLRYKNVAMAGPNYFMFASRKSKALPFTLNTRIYSCNLIRNDLPFRWRGRYNEDTILSLDMLKAGWCTILFNAFLQEKMQTQTLKGGNTDELYKKHGTLDKSQMLVDLHPDVCKVAWRFGRWHHYADYTPFKRNKLIRRDDVVIPEEPNEYGMKLVKVA